MRNVKPTRTAALFLALLAGNAGAGGLEVEILDREGLPVPNVAVYAKRAGQAPAPSESNGRTATMNQKDLAFAPHVLIVETGTAIAFPNDDDVRHHVYSFSPTKRLDLTIDSGSVHEPLIFDVPGLVTLGCNIHDDMLAYVLVVDTPSFTKSDAGGIARLDLGEGRYELNVWTPRLAEKHLPDPSMIDIAGAVPASVSIRFEQKLFPPHEHAGTSLTWDYE